MINQITIADNVTALSDCRVTGQPWDEPDESEFADVTASPKLLALPPIEIKHPSPVSFSELRAAKALQTTTQSVTMQTTGYPVVAKKVPISERLPMLTAATESLRSATAKYGYAHVQYSHKGFYFCFYKGVHTGSCPSAILAAFELLKRTAAKGIEITDKLEIDYYKECFFDTPKVDRAAIEYMLEPNVRGMYKGIKCRATRSNKAGVEPVNTFVCDIVLDGVAYRTYPYPTPQEAVWAVHNGNVKLKAAVYMPPPDAVGPADLSIIKHLQEGSGYKHVIRSVDKFGQEWFRGRYSVHGVPYFTKPYRVIEEAAWAVHHAIEHAPALDSLEKKIAEQTTGIKQIRIMLNREYAEIRKELVAAVKLSDAKLYSRAA